MLLAHLVPGYFAATRSQSGWKPEWSKAQRRLLWGAALVSTFAPDFDVIYNLLLRGFFNHSLLWTHSLFPHLGVGLIWLSLRITGRWPYLQTLTGLVTIGGLSHLLLDLIVHGTPVFYPFSLWMVTTPSMRIVEGGWRGYLTDPLFLIEPLLLALAAGHWIWRHDLSRRMKTVLLIALMNLVIGFFVLFLMLLPELQRLAM